MSNIISIPPQIVPVPQPIPYPFPRPIMFDPSCVLALLPDGGNAGKWMDESGKSNHGTVIGASLTSQGRYGPVYNFDGIDDYINLGTGVEFENNLSGTIIAWIKMDSISNFMIFANDSTGDNNDFMLFGTGGLGKLKIDHRTGGGVLINIIEYDFVLSTDTWYHVAVTSDGSTWKLYFNGLEKTTTVLSGSNTGEWFGDTDPNIDTFTIGALRRTTSIYSDGLIDSVLIFDRALTAQEIKDIYDQGI